MEVRQSRGDYDFHLGIPISLSNGKSTFNSFPVSPSISIFSHYVSWNGFFFFYYRLFKIFGCSPKGSSNSQPPKKREHWLFEVVRAFGRNFPMLSIFLWGMKGMFLFCFSSFKTYCKIENTN